MEESCGKAVATRAGPEPWRGVRKEAPQASAEFGGHTLNWYDGSDVFVKGIVDNSGARFGHTIRTLHLPAIAAAGIMDLSPRVGSAAATPRERVADDRDAERIG